MAGVGKPGAVSIGKEFDEDGVPLVALTFDDGPHGKFTPELLDTLARENTVSTFYVVGRMVEENPEVARRMVEEGHEIGNHTWSHPDLRKISDKKINEELKRTAKAIEEATGSLPYSTRPPYGAVNGRVLQSIPRQSKPVVMWTVDPQDWRKPGVQTVVKRVVEGCRPGAIILLHDIHKETILAVGEIIRQIKMKGYRFVTVSQILSTTDQLDLQ